MQKNKNELSDIHKGHRDRMRQRFERAGLNGFCSHEILEYLLYPCLPQKDTNLIAHKLISRFGSMYGVFNATVDEICEVKGMGKSSASYLLFVGALILADASVYDDRKPLTEDKDVIEFFKDAFEVCHVENVYMLALDRNRKVIRNIRITEGTIDSTSLSLPHLMRTLVGCGAKYVAVAHNHPSGFTVPSVHDVEATQRLILALQSIGVTLIDHYIIANDEVFSFKNGGDCIYVSY
jgi:DNA repair protein RadC